MAYKELIKNFSKIRGYLKEFFVYGYNARGNVGRKSERSYDDEKRRVQSWLGDYVSESHGPDGKTTALCIDVRHVGFNPLYRAWKSASFTDKDITLHFILMDILKDTRNASLAGIIAAIDEDYLAHFDKPLEFDESTIRKKLAEYERQGLVEISKDGNKSRYALKDTAPLLNHSPDALRQALDFASEILPLGIAGSTILDKLGAHENNFTFKHHYITQALDSEIMLLLFEAIDRKQWVSLRIYNERKCKKGNPRGMQVTAFPFKIIASSQNGRQYLIAYTARHKKMSSIRLDTVLEIKLLEVCADCKPKKRAFRKAEKYRWGATFGASDKPTDISFTVRFRANEEYIYHRLTRESRCGNVERLSPTEARFSATVWDAQELFTWIRTFIMRITELRISDKTLEELFWNDVRAMRALYDI